jgi:histone demethylase JARID1
MGPNIGEAVNFATHDWIEHGADANERYRSFARPAVFSHDRLTFTMAHHLSEQKSYRNCKLLQKEVERVVAEEMQLRRKLLAQGVRDVSDVIQLPKNRLDQLDEDSADYDDKRLCHACKHVCFFSAVACECSQSKVSCLRHSHYMCRCPVQRRYLMIWSSEEELNNTCQAVREHCEQLKPEVLEEKEEELGEADKAVDNFPPGVKRDLELHKHDIIVTEPYIPLPRQDRSLLKKSNHSIAAEVTTDEDRDEEKDGIDGDDGDDPNDEDYEDDELLVLDDNDHSKKTNNESEDEIEIIAVIGGKKR